MSEKIRRERVSVVVVHDGQVLAFRAEDPHSKKNYVFIPGGRVEKAESAQQAAVRETLEETGYTIEIVPGRSLKRRYDFEWDGAEHDCHTEFLAGKLLHEKAQVVNDADYHRGVVWIPLKEIPKVFGYQRDILEAVEHLTLPFP